MQIQTFITLYVISVPIFILVDLLWLGVFARHFYVSQIGHLMGDVRWGAAFIFYAVFLLGLTFFATYPAATKGTLATALVLGGLYGFFTYATYDLTNLATLRQWSITVTVVDILWGTLLGSLVACAAVYCKNLFL